MTQTPCSRSTAVVVASAEAIPEKTRTMLKETILGDKDLKNLMEGIEAHRPPRIFLIGRILCFQDGIKCVGTAKGHWGPQLQSKDADQAEGCQRRLRDSRVSHRHKPQRAGSAAGAIVASMEEPRE